MKTVHQKTMPRNENMTTKTETAADLDHFFSVIAARMDRWRELGKVA